MKEGAQTVHKFTGKLLISSQSTMSEEDKRLLEAKKKQLEQEGVTAIQPVNQPKDEP